MDKSKLMMIIIIVLLVLLLGTVVGVTFYLINMVDNEPEHDFGGPVAEVQTRLRDVEPIYLGDDAVTTHLAPGPDGRAGTLRTSIVVGIDKSGDEAEADEFMGQFVHRISLARALAIEILNGLSYEEVRTPEGQSAAGEIIMRRLQEQFETNLIVSVHFSNWLAQQGR